MFDDQITVTGEVRLVLTDAEGRIKEDRTIKNLVVSVGKTFIASRMAGVTSTAMSHFAIGTGNTAPVVGDTTLGAEAGRVALASSTPSANTVVYTASVPAGTGTGAIVEAGILNAASAGTMLCRTVFAVVNKGASDGLTATWTVTIN